MASGIRFLDAEQTARRAEPLKRPDGSPAGELAVVSDPEQGHPVWAGVWTCDRRSWSSPFDVDETFHVVAGHLRISADDEVYDLTPGVTAFFPKGLRADWEVVEPVSAFVVIA
jgi:uncharacterized cupin superfamily protein